MCCVAMFLSGALSSARPIHADEPFKADETWAFEPARDALTAEALLDLSFLNERRAGERGWITVNEQGEFIHSDDGRPARFWAVNTFVQEQPGMEPLREHARFLAKRGVNMVRWHGMIQPKNPAAPFHSIDERALDELHRLVAAMKESGIYTTVSPYYAHSIHVRRERGPALRRAWGLPRNDAAENLTGLLFFDETLQAAYKAWLHELFTRENPYTGLALRDDPAVALVQLQNEDSLLFWTFNSIQGADLDLLRRRFGAWLTNKYGALDRAREAWRGAPPHGSNVPDAFERGLVSFCNLWHLFQPEQNAWNEGGFGRRMSDQAAFLAETMHDFNADMHRYLREELGVRSLINAGNWRTADPLRLNDLERWSYTPAEVIGVNRYTAFRHEGPYDTWAVVRGQRYVNRSVTEHPRFLPVALKQVHGRAMVISEANWVPPNLYLAEGPLLTAAYQSLNGCDAVYWFAAQRVQWREPSSANGYLDSVGKWTIETPTFMGVFPAAALIYRRGDVRRAEPVVIEHRALDDLWNRRAPIISEEGTFDPNRDAREFSEQSPVRTEVDRRAFLVGPVETVYDSDPALTTARDLAPFIDDETGVVVSATNELRWDENNGIVTINTPRAQAAIGFLARVPLIALADIEIEAMNPYATVAAVSLDDAPIGESGRVLIQVITTARPTGWEQRLVDEGDGRTPLYEIQAHGRAPWRVERTKVSISIRNPRLSRAVLLDPNGYAVRPVAVERSENGVLSMRLPPEAMYVIVE